MVSFPLRPLPGQGTVLGDRYELLEQIGKGGFGIVYRARQKGLDEDVCVKVLKPGLFEEDGLRKRFEREVALAKKLRHPNTIRLLDVAETDEGLPYYVMEFLDGRSLEEALDTSGPMSPAATRQLGVQLLGSLAEAHAKGIVHRDLKPANIMLVDIVGAHNFAKVLDFGVAKALGAGAPGAPAKLTGSNVMLGTPHYMSPEQALGAARVDNRSDLYAVGLILAECLTARPVVSGDSMLRVLARHASPEPHIFSSVVSDSPLFPIIRRATAKDVDERFSDAPEMAAALEALGGLASESVERELDGFGETTLDKVSPVHGLSSEMLERLAAGSQATVHERPSGPAAALSDARPAADSSVATPANLRVWEAHDPAGDSFVRKLVYPRRRALYLVAVLVLIAGVVVAASLAGGPDASSAAAPSTAEPATEPSTAELAASGQLDPAALSDAPPSEEPGAGELGAADPAEAAALAGVATAVAVGVERLHGAVPELHDIAIGGLEGVRVLLGDRELGVTPFILQAPAVSRTLDVELRRPGYRDQSLSISLRAERVDVDLRRRRRVGRPRRDHEQNDPAGSSPFGSAPIDRTGP